jgi:hypothetical protein
VLVYDSGNAGLGSTPNIPLAGVEPTRYIPAVFHQALSLSKGIRVVSEHDVSAMWRELFRSASVTSETLGKAEALLEELKPESPLRHRLAAELDEICDLQRSRPTHNTPS